MTGARKFRSASIVGQTLLLAACANGPAALPAAPAAADQGKVFARASCAGCHSIERYGHSPNPNSPPFPAIANQEGLTSETLTTWLRGAHNYPREMDFYLQEREVDALAAYMLTLRNPNYKRPPD